MQDPLFIYLSQLAQRLRHFTSTLVLLNMDLFFFENIVDPDQLVSQEASCSQEAS